MPRRTLLCTLVLATAGGCAEPPRPQPPKHSDYVDGPAEPAQPEPCRDIVRASEIELLDAGRAPRKPLRLQPHPDPAGLPWVTIDGGARVQSRPYGTTAAGTSCHQLRIIDKRGTFEGGYPRSASLLIGPRTFALLTPARTKGELVRSQQLKLWMAEVDPRFPEEHVGIGARWRYRHVGRRTIVASIRESTTYTLVAREGTRVTLRVQLEKHRPAQELFIPGAGREDPPQRVDGWLTVKRYTLQLDLRRQPIPTRTMLHSFPICQPACVKQ